MPDRLIGRLAVAAALVLAGGTSAAPAQSRSVAVAAELSGDASRTRLVLTLSKPVAATAFLLERPDRAVIELPDVNFQLEAQAPAGLVSALRFGLFAAGRARIVAELTAPASVSRIEVTGGPIPGTSLLSIEFARTDRESFRRAVASDRTDLVPTTSSIAPSPARDRRPAIAIDAGHGGSDPGAHAPNGAAEKDITLAFAEALRDRLAKDGRYRIVMIREDDVFVDLEARIRRAREAGADLFLSIHADTISNPAVSGTTLYTGADLASDVEAATLADRENAADGRDASAGAARPSVVSDILLDLTQRETRGLSRRFSGLLLRDLGAVTHFSINPQREAGFRVLRSPDLAAVLVELGYLSHTRDLDLMLSPEWRARMTAAMAAAIDRFFAGRVSSRAAISP